MLVSGSRGDRSRKYRKNLLVGFFCLALASGFWTLRALEDTYPSSLTIPVKFSNQPSGDALVTPLPDSIKVNVRATGWVLWLRFRQKEPTPLLIDLKPYGNVQFISEATLIALANINLASKFQVTSINPNRVSLITEKRLSKWIKVKLNSEVEFASGFAAAGKVVLSPDSVWVTGPQSVVSTLKWVETQTLTLKDVKKDVSRDVELSQGSGSLTLNKKNVNVKIPVDRLTEKSVIVPLIIINSRIPALVRLVPSQIEVLYQTTLNQYSAADTVLFEAIVDGTQIDSNQSTPLQVQIVAKPPYAYSVRARPAMVNYRLIK